MEKIETKIKSHLISQAPELARKIVELQYERQPDYWNKFGERGKEISIRDAAYHLPFLAEAIETEDKTIFTNYVAWVKRLFRGLNFSDTVMISTLQCTGDIIKTEFPKDQFDIINEYIQAGLEQMDKQLDQIESYIDSSAPLHELTKKYNNLLLEGNRQTASKMILDEVQSGTPVREIYLHVFQKSQYEIGRLWLENKITVAKEHFCSAATQQIMSQLYPYIFSTERNGKKMVAASVGNELHEIGIRMVADFFEMDGWDTYYLGANTPVYTIIQAIEEKQADLVGLSIAITHQISNLRNTIEKIREKFNGRVKILIGGYALKGIAQNWKKFNADGYAEDAEKAVSLANKITAN